MNFVWYVFIWARLSCIVCACARAFNNTEKKKYITKELYDGFLFEFLITNNFFCSAVLLFQHFLFFWHFVSRTQLFGVFFFIKLMKNKMPMELVKFWLQFSYSFDSNFGSAVCVGCVYYFDLFEGFHCGTEVLCESVKILLHLMCVCVCVPH